MSWSREEHKNTASKPLEVLKKNARIISVLKSEDASLKDQHEIAFVVSKTRKFEDYKKVSRHEALSKNPTLKLTPYSEDLLAAMFGGW
ncbi:hypothetical protein PVJ1_00017 [Psychrobacillus phage PVJ1]|nr:hypothetical protein PVJ1_00017 [Psychrobacillus phage PVJ1]